MCDVIEVVSNGADHIAFHDLHMVNVVEQLESRGTHLLNQPYTPCRAIAHVIFVIHLAIEQFHANVDALFLCQADDASQTDCAVLQALFVGHAVAIARKADDVWDSGVGGQCDEFGQVFCPAIVVFFPVEANVDLVSAQSHGAGETVFLDYRPFVRR